jgi:hypothetical protein
VEFLEFTFKKGCRMDGYIKNNLLEPLSLKSRHDELVQEMLARGYNHNSPFQMENELLYNLPSDHLNRVIDSVNSLKELLNRCPECKNRYEKLYSISKDEKKSDDLIMDTTGFIF